MNLESEALKLASQGFAVLPLSPRSKLPMKGSHGLKDATTDPEQIRRWWSEHPDANIGIACGDPSHGLVVIDIDRHSKEKDGMESIRQWWKDHGDFPDNGMRVTTPNHGLHLYFRDQGRWDSPVNVLDGVDIRGNGSYIVAPCSVLPTGKYEQVEGSPDSPAMINDSVRDLLRLQGTATIRKPDHHGNAFIDDGKPILQGERNGKLSSIAGGLVRKYPDWTLEQLEDEVRKINQERCDPPLPDDELNRSILKSMKKWKADRDREPPDGSLSRSYFTAEEWDQIQNEQNNQIEPDDLVLTSLEDIKEKPVEWLVPDYIPKGMVSLLVGSGGVGKTTLWCSLVASISRGDATVLEGYTPRTDVDRSNRNVLYFSAEDSTENVLKKRLLLNHAVMTNIHTLDLSDDRLEKVKFTSPYLEKLIAKYNPALVVFDPLQSFIDSGGDMSKRNFMRGQMSPLTRMGEKYGCSFLILVHTNKQKGAWGRNRVSDSSDIWDQPRNILMVGEADKDQHTIYISQEKCNVGALSKTVILKNTGQTLTFESYTDMKDRDFVLRDQREKNIGSSSDDVNECCNIILSELGDRKDHSIPIQEMEEILKEDCGFSDRVRRRAKRSLLESKKIERVRNDYGGKCSYKLKG